MNECCQVQKETESQRQTEKAQGDRLIEWHRVRVSSELICNSSVLVIIREPQQRLLNYRSHRHDWMRLDHCNTNLIIYKLYYYSNNCMGKVSIFSDPPTYMKEKLCAILYVEQSYEDKCWQISHFVYSVCRKNTDLYSLFNPLGWCDFIWRPQCFGVALVQ